MTGQKKDPVWRPDDGLRPAPAKPGSTELFRPDVLETIEKRISEVDEELRSLSLDIHGELRTYKLAVQIRDETLSDE